MKPLEYAAVEGNRGEREIAPPPGLLKLRRTPRCERCQTGTTAVVVEVRGVLTALCAGCSTTERRGAAVSDPRDDIPAAVTRVTARRQVHAPAAPSSAAARQASNVLWAVASRPGGLDLERARIDLLEMD